MRVARNTAWLTAGRLTGDLLSAVLFVAISRHFGPEGVGRYSYGFAIAGFALVLSTLGLDTYGMRELPRLAPEARPAFMGRLLATQLAAAGATAAGVLLYLVAAGSPPATAAIVLLLAVHQVALGVGQTLFVPAYAAEAMRLPALAEMLCRASAIGFAILAIVLFGAPLAVGLALFPVAGLALALLGLGSAARRGAAPRLSAGWRSIRETARTAWPFGASEVVFQLYARADLILLVLIAGEGAAGIYAAGFKFVEVGVMPLYFLGLASFPRLSARFGRDEAGFRGSAAKLVWATLLLGGLLAWTLYFVAPALLVPLLGGRFAAATGVVRLMAALALLSSVEVALVRVLLAAGRQVLRLKLQVAGSALNVLLNLALIPVWGVTGAVIASLVTLALTDWLYGRSLRDLLPGSVVLPIVLPWIAGLAAAVVAGLLAARLTPAWWVAAAGSLAAFVAAVGAGSRATVWSTRAAG